MQCEALGQLLSEPLSKPCSLILLSVFVIVLEQNKNQRHIFLKIVL